MISTRRNDGSPASGPNRATGSDGTEAVDQVLPAIATRPRLPNGRAVIGGLLVTIATLGLFALAGRDSSHPPSYVVARRDIELGARLTADDVQLTPIQLPPAQAERAVRDIDLAVGSIAVAPLGRGDLVRRTDLGASTAAERPVEVSLTVPRARAVNGRLVPGEPVTVLGTFGSGDDAVTREVATNARVVEVHIDDAGLTQSADVILTLAVATADDGIAISHASQAAEVTIMRAPTRPATTDRSEAGAGAGAGGGAGDS